MANSQGTCQPNPSFNADPAYCGASRGRAYVKGHTPLNADVLSFAKSLAGMVRDLVTLLTRSEIQAIPKKEKASPFRKADAALSQ